MIRMFLDLEATCHEEQTEENKRNMEIIEIGAVIVNDAFEEISRFSSFARPVRNPILSAFCTQLTGIKQQDVDEADLFPAVNKKFYDWLTQELPDVWLSWGQYDFNQMNKDCKYHNVFYPLKYVTHLNAKTEYERERQKSAKGLSTTMRIERVPFVGSHHRALDDALNLAKLMQHVYTTPRPESRRG